MVSLRVTFHQWLSGGTSAIRTLPTIWAYRWRVSLVGFHSSYGRADQAAVRFAVIVGSSPLNRRDAPGSV